MVQQNKFRLVEVSFFRLSGCSCWDISEALLHIKKVFSQISYIKRENIGKRKSISIEISFFVHQVVLFGKFPILYLLVHRKSFQSHQPYIMRKLKKRKLISIENSFLRSSGCTCWDISAIINNNKTISGGLLYSDFSMIIVERTQEELLASCISPEREQKVSKRNYQCVFFGGFCGFGIKRIYIKVLKNEGHLADDINIGQNKESRFRFRFVTNTLFDKNYRVYLTKRTLKFCQEIKTFNT